MNRLARIQSISRVCRYALLVASALLGGAIVVALLTPGQGWVSIGEGGFFESWNAADANRLTLTIIMLPVAVTLVLGVYWLQKLLAEFQQGRFFGGGNMRCYLWLVWLKAFGFVYALIWPLLLSASTTGTDNPGITIDAGGLVELLVLLLIISLLREAQQLNEENQSFV